MEDEIIISLQLEFHLFRNYEAYGAFLKRKGDIRCCMMLPLGPLTCNIRGLAGVERNDYPIVVAMKKQKRRKKHEQSVGSSQSTDEDVGGAGKRGKDRNGTVQS